MITVCTKSVSCKKVFEPQKHEILKQSEARIKTAAGLRFENDKGTFDVRDYRKDNPLGFENLVKKRKYCWIEKNL